MATATITAEGVRRLRKRLGMTQRAFAAALGTQQMSVWRWESGRTKAIGIYVEKMRSLVAAAR